MHKCGILKRGGKIRPVPGGSYTLEIKESSENCKTKGLCNKEQIVEITH